MFVYAAACLLVFALTLFVVFYFRTSLSINDIKHDNSLLTSLLLSLGDGFYLWDEKKRVERFSPNLQILLNSIFCSFNELANFFEESDQLRENFMEARKINKSFTIDLRGRETEIYCCCYGQSIVDNQDKIVGVLLWIQNVTNDKLLISGLKHENAKLKQELSDCNDMVNILPYPIWKKGQDYKIKAHNSFYLKLLHSNKNDSLFEAQRTGSNLTNNFQKNAFMIVDNERKLYSLTELPLKNEEGFVGYGQDITQNWQLLQEVKGFNSLQKDLLNNIPCAVAVYSSDGRLLFCNGRFSKLWELDPSWMQQANPTYSGIVHNIYENKLLIGESEFEHLKRQQYELFGKLLEPYHDTLPLKNNVILKVSVIPNHRQELIFLYDNAQAV